MNIESKIGVVNALVALLRDLFILAEFLCFGDVFFAYPPKLRTDVHTLK